ncbi:MAG: DUF2510 domain-containing protein [Mycobacterium sp.]
MSSAGPRRGWYLDPDRSNTLRYWNGTDWTEHRQQTGGAPPSAARSSSSAGRGFKGFWTGLSGSGKGRIVIGSIAAVIVVGAIVVAQRPWESQNYKDCITANQSALDGSGTPGYSQQDLETYCEQKVGK